MLRYSTLSHFTLSHSGAGFGEQYHSTRSDSTLGKGQGIMSQPSHIVDIEQLEKGLQRVGLSLTEPELSELNFGNIISLERMELSEIGSLFILASAASPLNLGRSKQPIAFQDLPKATQDCQGCSGIPIYCWDSERIDSDLTDSDVIVKRCLYLTVIDGKPAVRVCCKSPPRKALNTSSSVLKS